MMNVPTSRRDHAEGEQEVVHERQRGLDLAPGCPRAPGRRSRASRSAGQHRRDPVGERLLRRRRAAAATSTALTCVPSVNSCSACGFGEQHADVAAGLGLGLVDAGDRHRDDARVGRDHLAWSPAARWAFLAAPSLMHDLVLVPGRVPDDDRRDGPDRLSAESSRCRRWLGAPPPATFLPWLSDQHDRRADLGLDGAARPGIAGDLWDQADRNADVVVLRAAARWASTPL